MRIPRVLATILILALASLSSINLALASPPRAPKVVPIIPALTLARESYIGPDDDPCLPHATKACIQQDLDDAKQDFIDFRGPDGGFADQLLDAVGFDPTEDIDEAKTDLGALSDTDFNKHAAHFDNFHKKAKKRKKLFNALLDNKPLMDLLHRPSPLKFVTASVASVAPSKGRALFVSNDAKDMGHLFSSTKFSSSARTEFSRGLTGLNVMVVPELTNTCDPGPGIPGGARDLYISKGVSLAVEVVRELIPDDTAAVIPQNIAVAAWAISKTAELVLEGLHAVYLECNAKKDGDALADNLSNVKTTVNGINSDVDDIQGTVNLINTNVNSVKTTVGGINTTVGGILTKINTLDGKADTTNNAVNTVSTNVNTIGTKVDNVNTNIDNSRTTIINNANLNAASNLRLLIEADLATPDSSTPLGIFETPAAKGGYIELVRKIVFETIQNLTGATAAQANATLASADSLLATGKYKAAYAALRKAYKSAAN